MDLGSRRSRPLGIGVTLGLASLAIAAGLWVTAVVASFFSECPATKDSPAGIPTGLDKGLTAWPPAADCWEVTQEALPWADVAIVALVALGLAAILVGLIAEINRLRMSGDPRGLA
jgi:hypothetical protein